MYIPKKPVQVDWNCEYKNKWYVPTSNSIYYLHNDGIVRNSTSVDGEYKGYFDTEQDAIDAIELYKKIKLIG